MSTLKITEIKENPNNPRTITKKKYNELVQSIKGFPEMLEAKPIVVNPEHVILGGNQRFKAAKAAGLKKVPVYVASWDEIKQQEFIIKDNLHSGEWDWDILANNHDAEELIEWGMEIPALDEFGEIEEEVKFSEYLDESNNYIVLTFNNDIDWLSAQTHFDLDSVYSKRQNGKSWSKGVGRVLDGAKYLNKLKK
jgi:ParB-like chromosome segregation protein Spo0J